MNNYRMRSCILIITACSITSAHQQCSTSSSCPSQTPYCLIYARNKTIKHLFMEQMIRKNIFVPGGVPDHVDEGYCVECLSDCHCGVNEYCGIDPEARSRITFPNISVLNLTSANVSATSRKNTQDMLTQSQAYVGLPMPSKCLPYQTPTSRCVQLKNSGLHLWGPIAYQSGDYQYGVNPTRVDDRTTGKVLYKFAPILYNSTYMDALNEIARPLGTFRFAPSTTTILARDFYESGKFCGGLSPSIPEFPVFAQAFHQLIGSFEPFQDDNSTLYFPTGFVRMPYPDNHELLSTRNNYNTATYCTKAVMYGVNSLSQRDCADSQGNLLPLPESELYAFNFDAPYFRFPAIAWQGVCRGSGVCSICSDGDKRCGGIGPTLSDQEGTAQICLDGKWVEAEFIKVNVASDIANLDYRTRQTSYESPQITKFIDSVLVIAISTALVVALPILGFAMRIAMKFNGPMKFTGRNPTRVC